MTSIQTHTIKHHSLALLFRRLYGLLVCGSFDEEEEGQDRGSDSVDDAPGAAKRPAKKVESIKRDLTDVTSMHL